MSINLRGAARLMHELKARGCTVEGPVTVGSDEYVIIRQSAIICGQFIGKKVDLAIKAPPDFPETPPVGFLVSPPLAPLGQASVNPPPNPAPGGGTWQFWSRQVTNWKPADAGKRLVQWWRTAFANYPSA